MLFRGCRLSVVGFGGNPARRLAVKRAAGPCRGVRRQAEACQAGCYRGDCPCPVAVTGELHRVCRAPTGVRRALGRPDPDGSVAAVSAAEVGGAAAEVGGAVAEVADAAVAVAGVMACWDDAVAPVGVTRHCAGYTTGVLRSSGPSSHPN
jgi:hypothetical protein